ncbi:unnamed protein product, partial [Allacma fusca]
MEEGSVETSASPNSSNWSPPNIHEHIQRCTCTCDHMGYGNYLDYQGAHEIELPDVSGLSPLGLARVVSVASLELNGSAIRLHNGRESCLREDSLNSSGSSSKDESETTKDLALDLRMKHWCFVCCVLLLAAAAG